MLLERLIQFVCAESGGGDRLVNVGIVWVLVFRNSVNLLALFIDNIGQDISINKLLLLRRKRASRSSLEILDC
jgi:hypothetical protein